jgi:hypothetical protein
MEELTAESNRKFEEHTKRMEELKAESNRKFEEHNKRMEELKAESNRKFEEHTKRMEELKAESNRKFEEHNKRMEELKAESNRKFEEHNKRMEEYNKRFEELRIESNRKFEEHSKILEEHGRRIEELALEVKNLGRHMIALGARWGMMAEDAVRNAFAGVLKEKLEVKEVKKWRKYDQDGLIYGKPDWVEADIAIKNGRHLLMEIKSSLSKGDVVIFKRIGELYQRLEGKEPELFILGIFVREEAKEFAPKIGVKIFTSME